MSSTSFFLQGRPPVGAGKPHATVSDGTVTIKFKQGDKPVAGDITFKETDFRELNFTSVTCVDWDGQLVVKYNKTSGTLRLDSVTFPSFWLEIQVPEQLLTTEDLGQILASHEVGQKEFEVVSCKHEDCRDCMYTVDPSAELVAIVLAQLNNLGPSGQELPPHVFFNHPNNKKLKFMRAGEDDYYHVHWNAEASEPHTIICTANED